jgi:hypothetical protein
MLRRTVGCVALGLSACGYPITQLAIRRWGLRGAALAETVSAGLAIRDATMVAAGVPARLRTLPAVLLRVELMAAIAASLTGFQPFVAARLADRPSPVTVSTVDGLRRAAVTALFAVHTVRFGIYLSPGQGSRGAPGVSGGGPVVPDHAPRQAR